MKKKASPDTEEVRLKKKIAEKRAAGVGPDGIAAFRSLRKRLKRAQRKRRVLAVRKRQAAGRQGAEAPASA
ncbi:MAG: hypothetical protein NNA21_09295 [Nitrospira sp.]|nr:hypothetical protein [Nitrospira sp.]MCP9462785.1 hypothetical protein [Nitrospira sp.]MCP9475836.1 hypothetical protein [Nitrospira sp.]